MAKPRKATQRHPLKDWWHIADGLGLPASDPRHITQEQFAIRMIFVCAAQRESSFNGRLALGDIARRTGISRLQAKRTLRRMHQRTMADNVEGDGVEGVYEMLPQTAWKPEAAAQRKLRPPTRTLRTRKLHDGSTEIRIPGQGIAKVWGDPEIGIRAGERIVATIRGADVSSLRIPEKATIETASTVRLAPEPAKGQRLPGAKMHQVTPATQPEAGAKMHHPRAESAAQALAGLPGAKMHQVTPATQNGAGAKMHQAAADAAGQAPAGFQHIRFDNFRGGSVLALAPKRGFTREVNKALAQMEGRHTHVEAVVDFLRRRGLQAMACVELEQKDQPGSHVLRRALLRIEAPPTGLWRQVKECIAKKMDPHRFETRMAPFGLEFGVCHGTELVEHKGGGHAEIFRAVEAALKAMGKPGAIRFVTIDSVDLDSVEAAQTLQRRSA